MSAVDIRVSGPLFDGRADHIMRMYCRRVEDRVGDVGVTMIRAYLESKYKYDPPPHDPGRYQDSIHTERSIEEATLITDGTVYGPWLEGVGSRNFPVTRFRGYHTFRVIRQELQFVAGDIAQRELPPYLEELRGA